MISNQELIERLQWRYATKRFNPNEKISVEQWETLEKALVLSPSSYGMQPWQFWVISNREILERLRKASFNQPQVEESSHFIVFTVKKTITEKDVENYMDYVAQVRKLPLEAKQSYAKVIKGDLVYGPRSKIIAEWATRQAYIALGNLMTCAAMIGVDTCPMEGMIPEQYDEILSLKDTDFRTVVACALGIRSEDDAFSKLEKVRFPASQVITHVE